MFISININVNVENAEMTYKRRDGGRVRQASVNTN